MICTSHSHFGMAPPVTGFRRIRASAWLTTSSDKVAVKHNEVHIVNGLEIIRQLKPQSYQKTRYNVLDENYNGDLSGINWHYDSWINCS